MGLFDDLANRTLAVLGADSNLRRVVQLARDPRARADAGTAFSRQLHRTFREASVHYVETGRGRGVGFRKIQPGLRALQLRDDGEPKEVKLAEWDGQRFAAYATDWEKKHCLPIGKVPGFAPVVDSNWTLAGWLLSVPAESFRVRLTGNWLQEREYSLASFRRGEQARYPGDSFVAWINWLGWPPPGPRRQKRHEVGLWKKIEGLDDYWQELPGWIDAAPFESGLSILFDPGGSHDGAEYLRLEAHPQGLAYGLVVVCDIDGQVQFILDTYRTEHGTARESWADPIALWGAAGLAKSLFRLLRSGLARTGFTTLFIRKVKDTVRAGRRGVREGDLVSLPRNRGASRVLTNAEMEALLRETLRQRPYLARLGPAQALDGPALHEEVLRILRQWEMSTGKRHLRVTDGTVVRLGSQGRGGWALDSLSGKEVLIIEGRVFKNSKNLLNEVTHELAYDAVREAQGVAALASEALGSQRFANAWLEAVITAGDRAWDALRATGIR